MAHSWQSESDALAGVEKRKSSGAYYTPDVVVESLVRWAVRRDNDRLLDPSCGDGRFLAQHRASAGVEADPIAAGAAKQRAPWAMVHEADFFTWAAETEERFECAAGNPPFIRYQRFSGDVRTRALSLCARHGARFSGLASSWAPFLVAAASLLKAGGRMAFVVPAEIGHAPYASPLLEYLVDHFEKVQVTAVRRKLFPDLSEDCWLLYSSGFGGRTNEISLTTMEGFRGSRTPPRATIRVSVADWRHWNRRLRSFLVPVAVRDIYDAEARAEPDLGSVGRVGIGYVSGANQFFHLRPSEAQRLRIPERFLQPTVRTARQLDAPTVSEQAVRGWLERDEAVLLLRLPKDGELPRTVERYLESPDGQTVRQGYKCRNREPWYSVPDVIRPSAFVSYMNGSKVSLAKNDAGCTCTNAVHSLRLNGEMDFAEVRRRWAHPLTQLSFEIEGHPLGGGMLKLEPREAARVVLARRSLSADERAVVDDACSAMQAWRSHV